MSVQIIESFVQSPAPAFRCYACGDESGPRFLSRIQHVLNPPASYESLMQIREWLGPHADSVADFYRQHDGFVLYNDTLSASAGVELFPAGQWGHATEAVRDWFAELDDDPDHILSSIAIATAPHSGNYFVTPVEGPTAGKIFYANHDGWYESAFADSFAHFLIRVTQEPVKLLVDELGCYARYSDGKTITQWIPEEYFADASGIES